MRIRFILSCTAPLFLTACVTQPVGDFGRKDDSVFHDTILSGAGNFIAAEKRGELVSSYEMTDQENELRRVAWDLVRPPGGGTWESDFVFSLKWARIAPDAWYDYSDNDFYMLLREGGLLSHETYYERLVQQAQGDASRMPVFRDVATRVGKADGARRAAITALQADSMMRRDAEARIDENIRVVDWVEASMLKRIHAYRTTLGRLMIEVPSTKAVDAEAAIDALEWEVMGSARGSARLSGRAASSERMQREFKPKSQKIIRKD
ncbi:MAG: hypothetical protein V4691_01670 [Pseudomonadota bacterium]